MSRPVPHDTTQVPAEHTCPAAQALPHAPQLARSFCRSRHDPEQSVKPVWHDSTHTPAEQTCPAAQALPHAPQWARSDCRSRHEPEQSV
ncbi:MAG: hypothetical protein R3A52_16415 [Polyangiales bacterium]